MHQTESGDPATRIEGATWRKSSYSNPYGNCVELAELADGRVAVRNSRQDRSEPDITCHRAHPR